MIIKSIRFCLVYLAWVSLLSVVSLAAPEAPPEGLKAEGEMRWDDAVSVYKAELEKDPKRGDLWIRIAQIKAVTGNPAASLEAWQHASELSPEDAALHFKLATAYSQADKPDQALASVEKAIALVPGNLEYLRARAVYANWAGNYQLAFRTYQAILSIVPDDVDVLAGLVSAASGLKTEQAYSTAAAALQKAADMHAGDASLRYRSAQAFSLANKPDDALKAVEKALNIEPKNLDYLRAKALYANWLGKPVDAAEAYRRILSIDPKDAGASAGIQNPVPVKDKAADYDGLIGELKKAVVQKPDDARLLFRIAQLYSMKGDPASALEATERALKLEPKNMEYLKASVLYANWLDKHEKSISKYKTILALVPDDEDALSGFKSAVSAVGKAADREALAAALDKAAALHPQDAARQFRAADAWSSADNPEKALAAAERALVLEPKNLEYLRAAALYANWLGNVQKTLSLYRQVLAIAPEDENALVGLQGAASWGGNAADYEKIADALRQKIALNPKDDLLWNQLAQTYAMSAKPADALSAVDKAVELKPENIDYLKSRAQYANWIGKLDIAEASYLRIIALSPDDEFANLNLARARSWGGRLDESVRLFKKHLKKHPEDKDALIDYVRVQSWRGNYAAAMEALDSYGRQFGETLDYRQQKARILASAEKPDAAEEVVQNLLSVVPNDYEATYSRTIGYHYDRRNRSALSSMGVLESLRPQSEENVDLRHRITADIRHSVKGSAEYYQESDSVSITTYRVEGGLQLAPELRLVAGEYFKDLSADAGSGLESTDGRDPITVRNSWVGFKWLVVPEFSVNLIGGESVADAVDKETDERLFSYQAACEWRPIDSFRIGYLAERDMYNVSPRAVANGVNKRNQTLDVSWSPGLKYSFMASGSMADFSDGNKSWEAYFLPKRTMLRTQRLNLDLGVLCWWLHFDEDPLNGYYAPDMYERYAVRADGYWKINKDNGVSIVFVAGLENDDTSSSFDFGSGGEAEGRFGLTPDWILKVRAGYTHNLNNAIGNFNAQIYGISLERQF